MPNWHALRTTAQALIDDFKLPFEEFRPKEAAQRTNALLPACPMLAHADPSCAPTKEQEAGMRVFAQRVAQATSLPLSKILNLVAKLNRAKNWDELLARKPEESAEPLYEFMVGPYGASGRFWWSAACSRLVMEQDSLCQNFYDRDEETRPACIAQIKRVTDKRRDFLEGLLMKATLFHPQHQTLREQGRTFSDAIKKAESLIPPRFRGEISWSYFENRFYHRLLYGYMLWHIVYGSHKRALALARKQLNRNQHDDLGVRFFIPLLMSSDKQFTSAQKALKRIEPDEMSVDPRGVFVRSLVNACDGQWIPAFRDLLLTLFLFPPIRDVINYQEFKDGWQEIQEKMTRSVTLDRATLLNQYTVVTRDNEQLEQVLSSAINNPNVKHAETLLELRYRKWRTSRSKDDFDQWIEGAQKQAQQLAHALMSHS